MWSHCTPVTYVGAGGAPKTTSPLEAPYAEIVIASFRRREDAPHRMGDHWSISCLRRDSDFIARGRDVVEAYDTVFNAYADFATHTRQTAQAVARALPTRSR